MSTQRNLFRESEQDKPQPRKASEAGSFLNSRRLIRTGGMSLVLFSVLLGLSFISFLFTGQDDQSVVESVVFGNVVESGGEIRNWLGLLGATLAHVFIFKWFGIGSFLMVPSLFTVGLYAMQGRRTESMAQAFASGVFILVWLSLLSGFLVHSFDSKGIWSFICGGIGYELTLLTEGLIGVLGTPALLILSLLVFGYFKMKEEGGFALFSFPKLSSFGNGSERVVKNETHSETTEPEVRRENPGREYFTREEAPSYRDESEFEEDFEQEAERSFEEDFDEEDSSETEEPEKQVRKSTFSSLFGRKNKKEETKASVPDHTEEDNPFSFEEDEEPQTGEVSHTPEGENLSDLNPDSHKEEESDDEEEILPKRTSSFHEIDAGESKGGSEPGVMNLSRRPKYDKNTPTFEDVQGKPRTVLPGEEEDKEDDIFGEKKKENQQRSSEEIAENFDQKRWLEDDSLLPVSRRPRNYEGSLSDLEMEFYSPVDALQGFSNPISSLLEDFPEVDMEVNRRQLDEDILKIVKTLQNFRVGIADIHAEIGPTVTLYEIVPAEGVKISQIRNLEDDIALNLSALGIRIIAPMPGKGTIGIEVPNKKREIVSFKKLIESPQFHSTKKDLPIMLGKTISNQVFITDLAKMPHLLIGGATGQGKSVGINVLITSLMYKKHPGELKFVLIDPKKVEFSIYNRLEKHYLAKLPNEDEAVVTEPQDIVRSLGALCVEMDRRYDLLKDADCRQVKEYNAKFKAGKLDGNSQHRFLPYIVVVIDELADLMITIGKEVEKPIARLAQMARAIGIHLVVATQRPSVNVVTGVIKANFPARMAFRVSSKVDSRIILDANGAEQLVGQGDMLLSNGSDMIRLQCAFVDTPEVERICDYIQEQPGYKTAYPLPDLSSEELERDHLTDDYSEEEI